MDRAGLLTGLARIYREAAPFRRRFAFALAASLALHATAIFGVRAGRGDASGITGVHATTLNARLILPSDTSGPSPQSVTTVAEQATREPIRASTASGNDGKPPRPAASGALPLDIARVGYYYLASRLQVAPTAMGNLVFEYPEDSPLRDGIVQVRVLISAQGDVDDAIVEAAAPPGVFDAAAVKALLRAKFWPGSLHGIAVASQLIVEVIFKDPGSSTLPGVSLSVKKSN